MVTHRGNSTLFQFAVLQYAHDPVTREFLNVGVVVYSKDAKYLKLLLSRENNRIFLAFKDVNRQNFASMMDVAARIVLHVESAIKIGDMAPPSAIGDLLWWIVKPGDESFRFDTSGGGIADDLDGELKMLFERFVQRHIRSTG